MTSSADAIQNSQQTTKNAATPTETSRAPVDIVRANSDEAAMDIGFRERVIKDIAANENLLRKNDSMKRYDIYKDGTLKYVREALQSEIKDGAAALDMMNRAVDISIVGSVIDKKAKVYKSTVDRKVVDDDADDPSVDKTLVQKMVKQMGKVMKAAKAVANVVQGKPTDPKQVQLDQMEKYIGIDLLMKKANRVLELHKNAMIKLVPYKKDDGTWAFDNPQVLHPHQYDVVEDANNPERPRMIILSHYVRTLPQNISLWTGSRPVVGPIQNDWRYGVNKETAVAGSPADEGAHRKLRFIWWTAKYHFVTDETGAIVDKDPSNLEDGINPIGELPFIPIHIDQDGSFWALGGDDLINMAVLINVLLTDVNFTMKYQGAGVLYAFGHGLPKAIQVGPNRAIIWEYQTGDPEPKVGFASSNPNIAEMWTVIEGQLGFLLSSNDLEVTSISGSLSAGRTNSGVQELIQRSAIITAIEDMQSVFRPAECALYRISALWANYLIGKGVADDTVTDIGDMDEDADVVVKFQTPEVYATELEKVQTLQARKLLGINTTAQLIQMDNPDLSQQAVQDQVNALKQEKVDNIPDPLKPTTQVDSKGNIVPPTPPVNPTNPNVPPAPQGTPPGPGAGAPPARPPVTPPANKP